MDEDNDGKIRRNLVVFSTLILLVAWLQIPVGEIAAKLFKLDELGKPLQISQFRLWVACFFVLLYMFLRYRFTEEFKQFMRSMRGEYLNLKREMIQKSLDNALKRYHKSGKDSELFKGGINRAAYTALSHTGETAERKKSDKPLGVVRERNHPVSEWEGRATIHFILPSTTLSIRSTFVEVADVPFEIPDRLQLYFKIRGAVMAAVYSEFSVRYLVPCAIALAAFGVVLYKLCLSF